MTKINPESFLKSYQRACGKAVEFDQKGGAIIQAASWAFGGHISKGLLNKARAAQNKRGDNLEKQFQKEIFYLISKLPNLYHTFVGEDSAKKWEDVNCILSKCHLAKWFSDSFDYLAAERNYSCYEKIVALKFFVNKYGNSREKKLIPAILEKNSIDFS